MTAQPHEQGTTPSNAGGPSFGRAILFGIVGVLAAVVTHFAIGRIGEVFRVPKEITALSVGIPGAADQAKIAAANLDKQYKDYAVWFAAGGAILGVLICLAQVVTRGRSSVISLLVALVVGAVVGGLFGAMSGPLSVYVELTLRKNPEPGQIGISDTKIMLMHALTWAVFGVGIGLAAAVAAAGKGRDILGSVVSASFAGLLGGVLFPFLVSLIDPLADPSLPLPEGTFGRIFWMALPFALMGLVIGRRKSSAAPSAT